MLILCALHSECIRLHSLHYPEAAQGTSDRVKGLGKMGILPKM